MHILSKRFLYVFVFAISFGGVFLRATESEPTGATVAFITYEAEAGRNQTTGTVVKMTYPAKSGVVTPEMEASGRGYVALTSIGQYLAFPNVAAANAIVIRHCIPDSREGGGMTRTLSLYVNGTKRQTLTLSSFHNWLYGQLGQNGQSNDPSLGNPHSYWDESRFLIQGGIKAGDTIRLQKDAGDTAAFYWIDLIDLENVAPPMPPPPADTFLSVTNYGAVGDGETDDTKAINACIHDAAKQAKIVWMPPGTYRQSERFFLNGVKVQGAGMWYTNLVGTLIGTSWAGNTGFKLTGSGSQVNDLSIDSVVHSSRADAGGKAITVTATNWRVQNVWITHTNVGFWVSLSSNGVIKLCRVRCTYADGININDGSNNNLIEDCSVRGCGDDGIALLSEARDKAITSQNTVHRNSVTAIWWGANCDVAGGHGEVIENNYLADNALGECFTVNLPPSFPMHPLTGATILHNTILRGGSNFSNQKRGAIWIYAGSAPISNLIISNNLIIDPVYSAIHLAGHFRQQLIASNNIISNPGGDGIYIEPDVSGSGTFIHNTVVGLPKGASIINNGSDLFTFTKEPN